MNESAQADRIKTTLSLIHEMQRRVKPCTPAERAIFDLMSVQSIMMEPQVMADNLRYWLDLSLHATQQPAPSPLAPDHSDPCPQEQSKPTRGRLTTQDIQSHAA